MWKFKCQDYRCSAKHDPRNICEECSSAGRSSGLCKNFHMCGGFTNASRINKLCAMCVYFEELSKSNLVDKLKA